MRPAVERRRHARSSSGEHELTRVCAEFREMPGHRITLPQAARLFGLDHPHCASTLQQLVERGVLVVDEDGMYQIRDRGSYTVGWESTAS